VLVLWLRRLRSIRLAHSSLASVPFVRSIRHNLQQLNKQEQRVLLPDYPDVLLKSAFAQAVMRVP
jgi:hypothetical protein